MTSSRRSFLAGTLAAPALVANEEDVARYIESCAKPDGGYGWADEPDSALSPTFAAVASYGLLKRDPPRKAALVEHIRNYHFPWPAARKKDRPMHRFDFEQVQALLWLGADISGHREEADSWTGPSEFTKRYELGGNPILKQEAGAISVRAMLKIGPTAEWRAYIERRRRANGSFNTTPAADGSDGHVANTWWGIGAMRDLGLPLDRRAETVAWVRSCQLANGGFTYAPKAEIGGVDQVYYTWAALQVLRALGGSPQDPAACVRYLHRLRNADGGFGDRPGYASNPVATWQALEALALLGARPSKSRAAGRRETPVPAGLHVYTLQVQAPGSGSPADAVELAGALRIHLWGAKNSQPAWIARAQQIANERRVPVTFFPADEEYGTFVSVPGLGTYSHLADIFAAPGSDFGRSLAKETQPIAWTRFREERVGALKRGRGGNFWQFNESEEISRVLLDEAVEKGTFAGISSFHFGNENFLHTQPFLNPYRDLLPTIGLQDAHTAEPWWWADFLTGFRTLYLARDASWDGLLEALRNRWVVTVRHDRVTANQRRFAGGSNRVRDYLLGREGDWVWHGRRPLASMQVIRPGDPFESGKPESGDVVRIRTWRHNSSNGLPKDEVVRLLELTIDGAPVAVETIERKNPAGLLTDIYQRHAIAKPAKGSHIAVARLKAADGSEQQLRREWVTL